MRIAVTTTGGGTICGHGGGNVEFLVYSAEGGEIISKERMKTACDTGPCLAAHDVAAEVGLFVDCEAVITRSMGQGLYEGLVSAGIMPVITAESNPEAAVRQFLSGGMTGALQGSGSCGGH